MILGWTRPQAIFLSAVALALWWVICRFAFERAQTRLRFSAGLGLIALAAQIALLFVTIHVFDDYSARFGSLSPGEFEALNARMDLLRNISGYVFVLGMAPSGPLIFIFSTGSTRLSPRWHHFLGIAVGLLLVLACLMLWLASYMPSGGMIG